MSVTIEKVAVIGGGTMGSGIAAACAAAGRSVLVLDATLEAAQKALDRVLSTAQSPEEREILAKNTRVGALDDSLSDLAEIDWICEAIIEDRDAKRALFDKIESARRDGSIVSTNTSGILLSDLTEGLPARLRSDILVSHFFNPVRLMKCVEIVPGSETRPEATAALSGFCRDVLGKGVVDAKDTVNFIANRIGCYWMLAGLHKAKTALAAGLSEEAIDALMGAPVGLPPTGLYGLIDLIGLDVMDHVGRNMDANLPDGDLGKPIARLPDAEAAMLARGQLGRKTGGGFGRVVKLPDGGKRKDVFDLRSGEWRPAVPVKLSPEHAQWATLALQDDAAGQFAWDLMGSTLLYAADLVPTISDDIVNVDRAMQWGYNWKRGPFQLIDDLGADKIIARLEAAGQPLPKMLAVLKAAGVDRFYRDGTALAADGSYQPIPAE